MQLDSEKSVENPLIWPLLTMLQGAQQSCKIHELASELQRNGLFPNTESDANKALFKRNFLLMNALFQLQEILLPNQWLQVQAMDIQLLQQLPTEHRLILEQDNALRSYYLDWTNFETSSEEIETMLGFFWKRYHACLGKPEQVLDKSAALHIFELDSCASKQDIRRQWRKLALKWHPDRSSGNALKFRQVCEAWQTLRTLS